MLRAPGGRRPRLVPRQRTAPSCRCRPTTSYRSTSSAVGRVEPLGRPARSRDDLDAIVGDWDAQVDLAAIVGPAPARLAQGPRHRGRRDARLGGQRRRRPRLVVSAGGRGGRAAAVGRPRTAAVGSGSAARRSPDAQVRPHPARHRAERLPVQQGRRGQRVRLPRRPGRRRPGRSRRRPRRDPGRDPPDARERRCAAPRVRPRLRRRGQGAPSTCATSASSRR